MERAESLARNRKQVRKAGESALATGVLHAAVVGGLVALTAAAGSWQVRAAVWLADAALLIGPGAVYVWAAGGVKRGNVSAARMARAAGAWQEGMMLAGLLVFLLALHRWGNNDWYLMIGVLGTPYMFLVIQVVVLRGRLLHAMKLMPELSPERAFEPVMRSRADEREAGT